MSLKGLCLAGVCIKIAVALIQLRVAQQGMSATEVCANFILPQKTRVVFVSPLVSFAPH